MTTRRAVLLVTALVLSASWAAAQDPPSVVATVGMIGDVAAEIAGDCAAVTVMMGPGSDPHLYRASAGDVRSLAQADLVLYGGLHLEAGLGEVLGALAGRKPVVAVSEHGVPEEQRIATGIAGAGAFDPHVWMDVSLWQGVAGTIAGSLADLLADDQECREHVGAAAAAYASQLGALHDWAEAAVTTVPEQQRVLVTAHDAFAYFGRAYGIDVYGIQGISTETEAAVADIRRIAELIVSLNVPAIFFESTINPRTVSAVQEAVAARGAEVDIGGELYADALGGAGTAEGTYVGMIVHNVTTVVEGLGGTVPELPSALQEWRSRW